MARWQLNPDGTTRCLDCETPSFSPASGHCKCPRSTVIVAKPGPVGEMMRLTAEACSEGMLDRLALERHLAEALVRANVHEMAIIK